MGRINFSTALLEEIFPFYILFDSQMVILSYGKSIKKVLPDMEKGSLISRHFKARRPSMEKFDAQSVTESLNQLILLECPDINHLVMRGQFLDIGDSFLFAGSPWMTSVEDVLKNNLTILDFANHDTQLDLLQILKQQQTKNQQLKDLLEVNNSQKEELRKDKEELNRLSLVASENRNAIVFTDAKAKIFWCNDAYHQITGFGNEDIIGKTPIEIGMAPNTDKETLNKMVDLFYKGKPFDIEISHARKDGSYFWSRTKGQPVFNSEGMFLQYFAVIEDMTEKKEMERQREELLASLEKSNNELEEYAQVVSHDLKSPLRSINSLIFWIKEDDANLSDKSLEYLRLIEGKVEKMDHLIQGILMYSKIDSATHDVRETVDTYKVVSNISETIDIPSQITLNISETLPVIMADNYRIHQLFQNLIGNAVNYMDKPQGIIGIDSEEHEDFHLFKVKDNGPGIAEEDHEKIFKTFQSLVKNDQSTGLGLSIVKKIVKYYKGEIWLESKIGEGTTFYVKLIKSL
jgi:PAS domain S-box-containing protein